MKEEYDFSEGEQGKFYSPDAQLNVPVYLDPENLSFIEKIATKKMKDVSTVVNEIIKTDRDLADAIE